MYPYLLHSGHLFLPTFGVLVALGLMSALGLSLRTARLAGLHADALWNAGLFMLLSAFVLSRLLLVTTNFVNFLHYPVLLLMVPSLTPMGILLTVIATSIYLRMRHLPLLTTLDAWAPCATLTWMFLALGHFAEGSDPGVPTTLPWGLAIPPDTTPRLHPVPLYAALAAAAITGMLMLGFARRWRAGDVAAAALAAAGVVQFVLTFVRQPSPYPVPFGSVLDPIQWIALGMVLAAGVIVMLPRKLVSHAV